MGKYVKNDEQLGTDLARKQVLQIIEAGFKSIDTMEVIREQIRLDGETLYVRDYVFHLNQYEKIYIVGTGKMACQAAQALEEILKNKIEAGAVIGVTSQVCEVITTYKGTHPLPSGVNLAAGKHMMAIGERVTEKDLVLAIVGGGGSSLLCSSETECEQGVTLYNAFLKSGGTIDELNVVRKHISSLKGGGLAKALYPATVVGLIFSDVPGGDLSTVASGPTYLDVTTIGDAQAIIDRYNLGSYELMETPKEPDYFKKVHNILVVSNTIAIEAMKMRAIELGYRVVLPVCNPYAKPEEVVRAMQLVAHSGVVVLFGGEPRLSVPADAKGVGGRNTYMALVALGSIKEGQVFASFASDGRDNSEEAGAIIDKGALEKSTTMNLSLGSALQSYDTSPFVHSIDSAIQTGIVDANVSDLAILLTPNNG